MRRHVLGVGEIGPVRPVVAALVAAGALALTGCGEGMDSEQVPPIPIAIEDAAPKLPGGASPEASPSADNTVYNSFKNEADLQNAIMETAFSYAWDARRSGPKPKGGNYNNYANIARAHVNLTAEQENDPNFESPETDCGVLVSIVMHKSGADINYPKRGTQIQIAYLLKNSDPKDPKRKFDRVEASSVKDLKRGDIAIATRLEKTYINGQTKASDVDTKGHTYIVTLHPGNDGKFANSRGQVAGSDDNPGVEASWGGFEPQIANIDFTYYNNTIKYDFFRPRPLGLVAA